MDILDAYHQVARESVMMLGDREHDMIGACAHRIDACGYGSLAELQVVDATSIAHHVDELEAPLA